MRDRKIFRRIAAMLMAGAMAATMSTGVMAEGEPAYVTITKKIAKEENVYAPATTFQFTIGSGTPVDATEESDAIYAGPEGGAYFAEGAGSILSAPADSDIGATTVTAGTTSISINGSKFTAPGIYRYVVKETAGSYEGVAYSTETKYFDVYVNSNNEVYSYTFTDMAEPRKKDDGVFINEYGVGDSDDTLHNLTVKKNVAGNQGNTAQEFSFTIGVTGVTGEKYYVILKDKDNQQTGSITLVSGNTATISLSHEETAVIYGLSASDSYTVEETDYSADGYNTTITIDGVVAEADDVKEGQTTQKDVTVKFTNKKEVTTPTGLVMDIAPYLLMVVAAAVLAVVFLRKRRIAE